MTRCWARAAVTVVFALGLLARTALPARAFTANDPFFTNGAQWSLQAINAPRGWDVATGKGTTIAVVDTGVDLPHEDLAAKIDTADAWNFVANDGNAQDDNGHGTHVSGIAAAITGNGKGIAGVAPDARIMPVKVLDSRGSGTEGNVELGIRWAADHHATVINLSLGDPTSQSFAGVALSGSTALGDAVQYAWSHGSIVVVAAGNSYVTSSSFSTEPALVVAATGRHNETPSYSSGVGSAQWGISAPGGSGEMAPLTANADDVISTYWDGSAQEDNAYAYDAGTSMAAPHVAGAAAVLRSLGLTPQQTVDRLLKTATPLGSSSQNGAGLLNLGAAVAGLGPAPVASPTTAPARSSGTTARPPSATPARSPTAPASGGAGAGARNPGSASPSGGVSPAPGAAVTAGAAGSPAPEVAGADLGGAPARSPSLAGAHDRSDRPWAWAALAGLALGAVAGGTGIVTLRRGPRRAPGGMGSPPVTPA
ncbi:MAG TPA: S8 family serine peptidase [Acidimicrobiales bacterium]